MILVAYFLGCWLFSVYRQRRNGFRLRKSFRVLEIGIPSSTSTSNGTAPDTDGRNDKRRPVDVTPISANTSTAATNNTGDRTANLTAIGHCLNRCTYTRLSCLNDDGNNRRSSSFATTTEYPASTYTDKEKYE
ncbi:hypothetical protein B0T21DRAFT_415247 [Apiosordaria backusii]|uniref:Uncharacterized protein n=1 Tax=Apiosordaria backusii TaxID=314023 RepID=A0AA40DU76_9PEZI|nr:hypothetical protein B0T21DRAFT_415247 [Apiosordaria backusii]